jgi:hypothetical protein
MTILDSPLNKAGKVKAVYIRTHKNVLISVNPKVCGVASGAGVLIARHSAGRPELEV